MRSIKILWLAIPVAFLLVIGLATWGPGPERKPEVKARIIAVKADPNDPKDVERARKKIQEAYEFLENGVDFSQVASVKSEASSADNNGDMGWIGSGVLPKHMEDILFKLKPGQYSEIFQDYAGGQLVFRILYAEQARNL